jgi:hypothetical protein
MRSMKLLKVLLAMQIAVFIFFIVRRYDLIDQLFVTQ